MNNNLMILQYDYTKPSGAQIMGMKLANELVEKNDVILVTLFMKYSEKPAFPISEKVQQMVLRNKKVNIFVNSFKIANDLKKIIIKYELECIISISPGMNLILFYIKKMIDIKVIYAEHANLENKFSDGKMTPFYRWIGTKKLDYVVVLTEGERNKFIKKYRANHENVITIPNWIESQKGPKFIKEKSNSIPKIISVGRLEYVKGFDMLLDIAFILVNNNTIFKWHIYGEGSEYENLKSKIRMLNLESYVYLMGHNENMTDVYDEYDLLVMTSRSEGLPLVLLEALTNKVPTISFDINSGPNEIIDEGNTGYLIEPYNLEEMASKIQYVIKENNSELAMNLDYIYKKYDKKNILVKWNNLINSLLGD